MKLKWHELAEGYPDGDRLIVVESKSGARAAGYVDGRKPVLAIRFHTVERNPYGPYRTFKDPVKWAYLDEAEK